MHLVPALVMGTIIGKSPPDPQAITGHILKLSNSRFEIFSNAVLPTFYNFERYKIMSKQAFPH